jgi:hypothetical protein
MKRNKVLALVPVVGLSFALLALSASPGHGYVSVPAAAFQPTTHNYEYTNSGYLLSNSNGTSDNFVAPVQLPQGATVTKVTFYFFDSSSAGSDYGRIQMFGNENDSNTFAMADVLTTDAGGAGSNFDDSIDDATIDNSQYSYYLRLTLNTSVIYAYGVIIEYTYATSLPLIVRNFQIGPGGR